MATEIIRDHNIYDDPRSQEELICELSVLRRMLRHQVLLNSRIGAPEASWGERVWSRILDCALDFTSDVARHNVTTAMIGKEFRPCQTSSENASSTASSELSGTCMASRSTMNVTPISNKVEYAIAIIPKPAPAAVIRRIVVTSGAIGLPATINQTHHYELVAHPAAIAIEAKTPEHTDQQNALRQLSIWTAAWHQRMRALQLEGYIDKQPERPLTHLPLISIQGQDWHLVFAIDDVDSGQISITKIPMLLGNSRTLYKFYKLLASLRALLQWADGPYRLWWDSILGVPPAVHAII